MKKVIALSACVALMTHFATASKNMLDFDIVLDFQPAACTLSIVNAQVNLGVIPFNALPDTGVGLLDRESGLTWNATSGPAVTVDCNGASVPLAFLIQDNSQESVEGTAPNRLGLGRFNDSNNAPIGYFQLLPQNVQINNAAVAANTLRTSANGMAWQSAPEDALVTNRDGLINSWQGIVDSVGGVSSLSFDLAGKVYLNGQDRVSAAGRSAVHEIQGSVTLTIVMF
ncbi:MAG: hypothetical protein JJU30_12975 [Alkalimonas sp.]|nr:hypothetical protein [Alkalimonas sp.]